MNSKQSSNPQSPPAYKWLLAGLLLAALLGFADTAYLTAFHYLGVIPTCALLEGCEVVLTSQFSVILGVPLALIGAVYYLALVLLSVWYLDRHSTLALVAIFRISTLGLLTSIFLLGLQIFVLRAICIYCLTSIFSTAAVFIISACLARLAKKF